MRGTLAAQAFGMDLTHEIRRHGGLAATHELLRSGATSYDLARAVGRGAIIRARQGWYTLPGTEIERVEAVRVGGRLSCISGGKAHGLWVRDTDRIHVRVGSHDSRLRTRHDHKVRLSSTPARSVVVHWGGREARGTRFVLSVSDCLVDIIWCQSPESTVAAADSAMNSGLLTPDEWRAIVRRAPLRLRRLLECADSRSQSIIESITRFRLQMLGYHPRPQVHIAGVGWVDLLLGRLVIELDGWEFHKSRAQFEEDRRRDAALAIRGYRVLRFTYRQVMGAWHKVLGAIRACLR